MTNRRYKKSNHVTLQGRIKSKNVIKRLKRRRKKQRILRRVQNKRKNITLKGTDAKVTNDDENYRHEKVRVQDNGKDK